MGSLSDTVREVRRTISRHGMLNPGDRVITAVSGGPDSVCLLSILHELKGEFRVELVVAHFDHGLRPREDERETRFVSSLAHTLGLPFETREGKNLRIGDGSLEEKAREARYRFLEESRKRHAAQRIALGHSLNDQAETVLMRLLRGSGPSGLSGIPPCREGIIIRPLIGLTRGDILSYLNHRGLSYTTDSSNVQVRHLRNRIRIELLPLLEKFQPRIVEILGRTAEIMRDDEAYLAVQTRLWVDEKAQVSEGGEVILPIPEFLGLPEALKKRVIRHALGMRRGNLRRIQQRHIDAIKRMTAKERPQAQLRLPEGLTVSRVYDRLVFDDSPVKVQPDFCFFLDGPGTFDLEDLGFRVSIEERKKNQDSIVTASNWTALLDGGKVSFPLAIRNFRPGDRFVPYGMTGHKKLKDYFIERKIPLDLRGLLPILTHRNRPIWVCGLRLDDRFKVTPETENVLKVEIRRWGEGVQGENLWRHLNLKDLPRAQEQT